MKILIVKTSAIGDVLQTFPVAQYLRSRFPEARLDWVVEKSIAPLLKAYPLLDQVLEVDTKQWRKNPFTHEMLSSLRELRACAYDILFDLQGNWKSGIITACARANKKVGWSAQGVQELGNLLFTDVKIAPETHVDIRTQYLKAVQDYFQDTTPFQEAPMLLSLSSQEQQLLHTLLPTGKGPLWMVCFGSNWKNKQLPQERWLALLKQCKERYNPFFLFIHGNDKERKEAEAFHSYFAENSLVLPRVSLPLLQHVMAQCAQVLSVDSAALHLCATINTPSWSFFGPSLALRYQPKGAQHRSIQGTCPYHQTFKTRCKLLRRCPTGACMTHGDFTSLSSPTDIL